MCTFGTWLSIDFHGEKKLILAIYIKTKKAFQFRQNPAKNGFNKHAIYYYLPKYYQIKRSFSDS